MAIKTANDQDSSPTKASPENPESRSAEPELTELSDFSFSTQDALEQAARSLEAQVEKLSAHEFTLLSENLPSRYRDEYDPNLTLSASRSEAWDDLVAPLTFEQWEQIVSGCQEKLREVADFEPKHAATVQRAINSLDDCLRFICAEDLEGAESALLMSTNSFRSIRAMAQYQDKSHQNPEEEFAQRTLDRSLMEFEKAIGYMADYLLASDAERDPAKLWGMWNSLSDGVMIIHAAQRMQDDDTHRPILQFEIPMKSKAS